MAERRTEQAHSRPKGMGRALLWTAGSLVVPGIAHLRTGHRLAGGLILACYLLLVGGAVTAALLLSGDLLQGARMAVQGRWLLTASVVAFVLAVLWMTVVIHSYLITRPPGSRGFHRFLAGSMVTVLCLVVATPAAAVVYTSYTAYDTLSTVFGDALAQPHDASDPWNGQERVNVLLLGGDSGDNRYGMRTDSMMVASIDVEHGDVMLIGLPRNLENVPFPEGTALAERYPAPYGFDDLLNEVYQTVVEDETLAINPDVQDPAADTLKQVIGGAVGLDIEYYMLVDMQGFEDLIDAIGGIEVLIEEPLEYGQRGEVLEPGLRTLNGEEALWYGRTRVNSDDYSRMGRQGCLIKYVAQQANPTTILTSFQGLAGATKRTLRTDVPQAKIPHFVDLAELVASGDMETLQLSPPQVDTAYPDWERIHELVDDAVRDQENAREPVDAQATPGAASGPEPSPSASPSDPAADPSDTTEWQDYTGLNEPSPTSPGRQVGEDATSLDALCP
ncbi:LCP family protein [Actinorugispora endophytica]|uniref:LytR family transcriptional attenuator n=1 Tax=Actinorugispora endophytica TaxID=1605990 RepID=A0A4R6V3Z2_9ACTN|nr:LCP family protein [Actinorugispora endophytica]TDQ53335.1 LytR family transcriptional attenuator [Actinorugispora endophytica]